MNVDPSISRAPIAENATDLPTVCVLCSHNCGLRVDVERGRVKKVRADPSNPITKGYVCNKGFTIPRYIEHAQRLTHPLKRLADGSFEKATWEQAITEIGSQLRTIVDQHGASALGLVGIGGQGNHMDAGWATAFLRAMGSRRWFNAYAQEKTQHHLVDALMFDASPAAFFHADTSKTNFLLVMGTNPKVSHRGHRATDTFKELGKRADCQVVVVDPRVTDTSKGADQHVRVQPGTDVHLLTGIAATIVQDELFDGEFLETRTQGYREVAQRMAGVSIDEMARRCGMKSDALRQLATDFAAAPSASIFWDLGVEQTPFSTTISYLIRLLHCLTGNAGRSGGSHFMEIFAPPTRSAARHEEPERAISSGIQAIRALGQFGMFSPTLVPEETLIDHPDRIRALVVEGANPMLSYSDTQRWTQAFDALDLLVVIEPAFTETARMADWILPTPVGYEKWEIAMFPKRYPEIDVQLRPPVIPARGEALPEPEIYARLLEACKAVRPLTAELETLAQNATPDALDLFTATAAQSVGESVALGMDAETQIQYWLYRGPGRHLPAPSLVGIMALCQANAAQRREAVLRCLGSTWTEKSPQEITFELFRRILAHPEGVQIAQLDPAQDLEANVGWPDGKIRLAPELLVTELDRAIETPPQRNPDFPLILGNGLRTRWTANTIHRDPHWRKGKGSACNLSMSPDDAKNLNLRDNEQVLLVTNRASAELPVEIDEKMLPGHVAMPNGFGMQVEDDDGNTVRIGINMNSFTDANDRDPITGCPHHRQVPCRVEKLHA